MSWKMTVRGSRAMIVGALLAHEDAIDWDPEIVLGGCEEAEDRPDDWRLEAWIDHKPTRTDKAALIALFGGAKPKVEVEQLPETDWVTQSQQGIEPIREGTFHVHTRDHPPLGQPGVRDFMIPASRAFGTGQHATTAGCLAMLTQMKRSGAIVRNLADIGTGTGLLAFAAMDLWPRALATASDIDAVCAPVVYENAELNGIAIGGGAGEVAMVIAAGMDNPLIEARGPYDLVIANILAGPLVELAPAFSRAMVPGGNLLLAGLLETQEQVVRAACRAAGLRLAARMVRGDWSILWLRKRQYGRVTPARGTKLPEWARRW